MLTFDYRDNNQSSINLVSIPAIPFTRIATTRYEARRIDEAGIGTPVTPTRLAFTIQQTTTRRLVGVLGRSVRMTYRTICSTNSHR